MMPELLFCEQNYKITFERREIGIFDLRMFSMTRFLSSWREVSDNTIYRSPKMKVDAKGILYLLATKWFNLKRDDIEARLKLQKTVYLLEAFGLQLGYGFNWYKYGPYSQDLVHDAYEVLYSERNEYENRTKSWRFSEDSEKRFDKFKDICADILDDPDALELVASVDFVNTVWYPDAAGDEFASVFMDKKKKLFSGTPVSKKRILDALVLSKKLRELRKN